VVTLWLQWKKLWGTQTKSPNRPILNQLLRRLWQINSDGYSTTEWFPNVLISSFISFEFGQNVSNTIKSPHPKLSFYVKGCKLVDDTNILYTYNRRNNDTHGYRYYHLCIIKQVHNFFVITSPRKRKLWDTQITSFQEHASIIRLVYVIYLRKPIAPGAQQAKLL